jgi:hypothetical protein
MEPVKAGKGICLVYFCATARQRAVHDSPPKQQKMTKARMARLVHDALSTHSLPLAFVACHAAAWTPQQQWNQCLPTHRRLVFATLWSSGTLRCTMLAFCAYRIGNLESNARSEDHSGSPTRMGNYGSENKTLSVMGIAWENNIIADFFMIRVESGKHFQELPAHGFESLDRT